MLDKFCADHGFVGFVRGLCVGGGFFSGRPPSLSSLLSLCSWFETSAKTNHNIEESVRALVSNIMTQQVRE